MPAIDFPSSPINGQSFTAAGITWIWNATKNAWVITNNGVQGFQGVQGAQGFQGVQGPSGGPQGAPGVQGAQGFQGSQGFQGVQGGPGSQGAQGNTGAQGTDTGGYNQANLAYQQANNAYVTANAAFTYSFPLTGGNVNGSMTVSGNINVQNNIVVTNNLTVANNITSNGTISDVYGTVRKIPISGAEKTTAYTLTTTDVGRTITITTGGSVVLPNSLFTGGDAISLYNNTASNVAVTAAAVCYISGVNVVRTSMNIYPRGMATVFYSGPTSCVLTGSVG